MALAACSGSATTPVAIPPGSTCSTVPVATTTPSRAPAPPSAPLFPATVIDDEGTSVTVAAEPRKIVSLTPATTEILFALGVGDRLVGKVEDFSVYPPAAAAVPDVAKFGSVDKEKIVKLGADLVIAGGNNFNPPDDIRQLRTLGIPVIVVYAANLDAVLADIELTGRAIGRTNRARDLVTSMRAGIDQVAAATRDLPKPKVYYELDATNGFFGPAPDYFGVEMMHLACANPLTSGKAGVFQIPEELIVAFNPDIILLGDAAYGVTAEQVAKRPAWSGMTAVKTGAIRPVDDVVITRPGPRLVEGLRALALAIHPEVALPSAVPLATTAP